MKYYQKILLGILITIFLIIGAIQIYLSFFLDDQLKQTAVSHFHKATDKAYSLKIGDIDLEMLGRQLEISNIKLTQKEQNKGKNIRATINDVNISGISVLKYLLSQKLSLSEIEINNPNIYITSSASEKKSGQTRKWNKLSKQLSGAVLQEVEELSIPEFSIEGLQLNVNRADIPLKPYISFKDANIHFYDITIDSSSLKSKRIIPADNLTFGFRHIRYQTPNELYELTVDTLNFSSEDSIMNIEQFHLRPKLEKYKFAMKVGHRVDRIETKIESVNFAGIDAQQLNHAEGITTQHITIAKPDLEVYHDKRPPSSKKSRQPPLPQQMIRNIPIPLKIDSVSLKQGHIRYSERAPQAEEAGYIDFKNLKATFKQITNIENLWADNWTPILTAKTDVMGKAELNTHFSFPMETNRQHITGNLGSMEMQPLNETFMPLAFIRIDDGTILDMNFEMSLGPKNATGSLTMRYEDFKVSLLNKKVNEETFGKEILSLLANKLKFESENTGENPRTANVDFERIQEKSTFNYWWKSLLSGLKSAVGF